MSYQSRTSARTPNERDLPLVFVAHPRLDPQRKVKGRGEDDRRKGQSRFLSKPVLIGFSAFSPEGTHFPDEPFFHREVIRAESDIGRDKIQRSTFGRLFAENFTERFMHSKSVFQVRLGIAVPTVSFNVVSPLSHFPNKTEAAS